jgi:hypothetical protein
MVIENGTPIYGPEHFNVTELGEHALDTDGT